MSLKKIMQEENQEIRLNKLHWFAKKMFIAGVIISIITILLTIVVKAGAYRILSMKMYFLQTLIVIYAIVSFVFLIASYIVKKVNPNHEKHFYRWTYFYDLYDFFMKCICVLTLFMVYAFSIVVVKKSSMTPTYKENDIVIVRTVGYRPKVNDVTIVYREHGENGKPELWIKRIVAGPGDVVESKNGSLYINDVVFISVNNYWDTALLGTKVTLGDDEFFLIGDNDKNSLDSRKFGPIKKKDLLAKVVLPKRNKAA